MNVKYEKYIFPVVTGILVLVAVSGLLENYSFQFVRDIYQKNLGFLATVTEIKLILSSLSTTHIPFISGETTEINTFLDKAQTYLLYTNSISVIQLMLLALSKSWVIKISMIVLFALTFLPVSKPICTRILIITLAINPGLALYASAVQQLSGEAYISYGADNLNTLQKSLTALRAEKAKLALEHSQKMTQIANGNQHGVFFQRLKEDISFDAVRAKADIVGDYKNLRILLHDAGYDIARRIFLFCNYVLFSLLLLPLGYVLLVYILYGTVFQKDYKDVLEAVAANLNLNKIPVVKKAVDIAATVAKEKETDNGTSTTGTPK